MSLYTPCYKLISFFTLIMQCACFIKPTVLFLMWAPECAYYGHRAVPIKNEYKAYWLSLVISNVLSTEGSAG